MGRVGGVEYVLSGSKDLGRLAVVDHRRRQQTEPGVLVLVVV